MGIVEYIVVDGVAAGRCQIDAIPDVVRGSVACYVIVAGRCQIDAILGVV